MNLEKNPLISETSRLLWVNCQQICELPGQRRRKACFASVSGSREEFHESQPEAARDSMLWSLSFLLLTQRNFNGWGTKGRSDSPLRLEGCTLSGQRGNSPTLNQLKCVLLCLCFDWEKQSGENWTQICRQGGKRRKNASCLLAILPPTSFSTVFA